MKNQLKSILNIKKLKIESHKSLINQTIRLFSDYDEKTKQLRSIDEVLKKYIPEDVYNDVCKIHYGKKPILLEIPEDALKHAKENSYELAGYKVNAAKEEIRSPRIVRLAGIQTKFPADTSLPVKKQMQINFDRYEKIIEGAKLMGVNVLGLQETWTAPFFFCTRENSPWLEFAESAFTGESTQFLKGLAKKHNMVIVSPILERCDTKQIIWNTAIIIDNHGELMGRHHKVHIPRVGDFNESSYYMEGQLGSPVFETEFGKIGVNICFGRHHPLHWLAYGLNGAEIVYNPSATVNTLSEGLWPIEARNAAIANNYFSIGINRVGTETFPNEFTSGDGKKAHKEFGHFYGSTYLTSPDGSRTPGLSRTDDGLHVTEVDLNLCRQIKDSWNFMMTGRHEIYAKLLNDFIQPDFKPDIVKNKAVRTSLENNKETKNNLV